MRCRSCRQRSPLGPWMAFRSSRPRLSDPAVVSIREGCHAQSLRLRQAVN
jgi:hypothetical protein